MDIQNKKDIALPDPVKKSPEGMDMNKVAMTIGWQIPTWIATNLWEKEFKDDNRVVDMFSALGAKIESLSAIEEPGTASIAFDYWRLSSTQAKKRKPMPLLATLYQHPDYDTFWMDVTYA